MKENMIKVRALQNEIIEGIELWFKNNLIDEPVKLRRPMILLVEVVSPSGYDAGYEGRIGTHIKPNGDIIDEDGNEIKLNDLGIYDIAYILDQLQEGGYAG